MPHKIFKPRASLYLSGVVISLSALAFNLASLTHSEAFITRAQGEPFTYSQDHQKIINHYIVHLTNQSSEDKKYRIQYDGKNGIHLIETNANIQLKPKEFQTLHVFFEGNTQTPNQNLEFSIEDQEQPELFQKKLNVTFVGPTGIHN